MYEAEEERVPAFGSFISACGAAARIIAHRTFIPTTTATAATTNSAFSHRKVKARIKALPVLRVCSEVQRHSSSQSVKCKGDRPRFGSSKQRVTGKSCQRTAA
jgi:hypothetical protein